MKNFNYVTSNGDYVTSYGGLQLYACLLFIIYDNFIYN
jgi:hypothetical protein